MSLRPGQETGARRLRGGCIPCPVRVATVNLSVIRFPFTDHQSDRMDGASASHFLAAADRMRATPPRNGIPSPPSYGPPISTTDTITDNYPVTICGWYEYYIRPDELFELEILASLREIQHTVPSGFSVTCDITGLP